jgi:hypothetical protein
MPMHAKFTLSLGAIPFFPNPKTDEGKMVTPAKPASATLLFFKKSLLFIFL